MAAARFPVEEGAILVFARAIHDPNPAYTDVEAGVLAPPTFVQAAAQFDPDYPLRPRLGEAWFGSGKEATGRAPTDDRSSKGTGLHAEQHFEYHRPLRAGDLLSSTSREGSSWTKDGRSGRLVFSETITEFRDPAGELVVTARSVAVMTERPVGSEG